MLTKLIKNSIFSFIFIFLFVFGINKVNASTKTITFDFPFNDESFSVDLDTDTYPYYIGTMYTNYDSSTNSGTFRISFYYSDEPFYYTSGQSNYCQIPGYMSTYCYGFIHKANGSNAKVIVANYSITLNTEITRDEYNYTSNAGAIARYNYRDFVDNVGSFRWLDNNYPYFDGGVGWILSYDLKDSNGNIVLSKDYINLTSLDNGLDYEDLNSSGSIEQVEFTYNNITFNHLLKIKISDLYRSDNSGYYKPYFLTYMSSISTGVESNFYITYDKSTNGKPNFPLSILFKENLGAIEKIANGSEDDPFSFEYYGNRLPECSIESSIPLFHTTYNDSPNFYNYLLIYPTWYCGYYGDTWEPSIWGNDYIYIYYNARLYNDLGTLEEDFENNPSNFEDTDFFSYMVRSLDHFTGRIVSIFKIITIFFNSLPYEIRLMFIAVFTLIITLLIYKVIG